ncbi:MAG: integrase arm-type DNA-binding domain-containing protein, partial [Smithellaceae bacterium]
MPKKIKPLSEMKIRNAKVSGKDYKLFDGDGLFLLVTVAGGKLWRFKYRFGGKEKTLSFGAYPAITLLDARQRRDEARKQMAHGVDPGAVLKAQKQASIEDTNTFEVIAIEWHDRFTSKWSAGHARTIMSRMEQNLFPWIGKCAISEIKVPELLAALRRVEDRGALETAHRIRAIAGQVFRYAVATARAERDISADLRGALPPPKKKHRAAITKPPQVGKLLRAIDGYSGSIIVKSAFKLAPLVFVRPGELRQMEWSEVDLANAEWNIPAVKMKMKEPHMVPLSRQALEILEEIKLLTGAHRYAFPSGRSFDRPMSDNAILAALRRMGYDKEEMSGHGFRAIARTLLDEVLHVRPELIEHQLAHTVKDPLGRAYNRTKHLDERRIIMQAWADYLDELKLGAK